MMVGAEKPDDEMVAKMFPDEWITRGGRCARKRRWHLRRRAKNLILKRIHASHDLPGNAPDE